MKCKYCGGTMIPDYVDKGKLYYCLDCGAEWYLLELGS